MSSEKGEFMVPSIVRVEQYERGGVIARTWTERCKQEKQCFPQTEDGDQLRDPSLATKAKRVHCHGIEVVVVDGRKPSATLRLGQH